MHRQMDVCGFSLSFGTGGHQHFGPIAAVWHGGNGMRFNIFGYYAIISHPIPFEDIPKETEWDYQKIYLAFPPRADK